MHIKVVLTLYCNWCYAIALYPKIALVQKILMIIWVVGKMIPTAVLDAGFNLWRCVIVCEALYELYPYENKWNQMRCVQWATQLGVRAMRISKRLGTFSSIIEQVTLSISGLRKLCLSEFSGSNIGLSSAYLMCFTRRHLSGHHGDTRFNIASLIRLLDSDSLSSSVRLAWAI